MSWSACGTIVEEAKGDKQIIGYVTSEEDLAALKETCGDNRGGRGKKCFKPVFPLTINFPDGTSATVADKDEAKAAKKAFKASKTAEY